MIDEKGQWVFRKYDHLQDAVKRFFEILNTQEFSDNAQRHFNPVRLVTDNDGKTFISSIRVFKTAELASLLPQMEIMSGYRQEREMKEWNI